MCGLGLSKRVMGARRKGGGREPGVREARGEGWDLRAREALVPGA